MEHFPNRSQIESRYQSDEKSDVPKPSELLYPMVSVVLLKYVCDDLGEFRPVFYTCTITGKSGVISKGRLQEDFLRKKPELPERCHHDFLLLCELRGSPACHFLHLSSRNHPCMKILDKAR